MKIATLQSELDEYKTKPEPFENFLIELSMQSKLNPITISSDEEISSNQPSLDHSDSDDESGQTAFSRSLLPRKDLPKEQDLEISWNKAKNSYNKIIVLKDKVGNEARKHIIIREPTNSEGFSLTLSNSVTVTDNVNKLSEAK